MASEKLSTKENAQKHPEEEEEGQMSGKQAKKRKRSPKKVPAEVEEDSRFIYTNKRLRQFPCHVSNYSSLHTLRDIRNSLSKSELAQVRKTSIGHLVDMPDSQKWSSALFSFLMTREIHVAPEKTREGEVWFRVEGKDLCFCKADFKAVTGLPFKESGKEIELKGVSHLKKKLFEGLQSVEGIHLYEFLVYRKKPMVQGAGADSLGNAMLSGNRKKRGRQLRTREPVPCSSDERVKVALLLMVHVFILGRQLQHKVDDQDWLSVENIEDFNRIPWGEKSYVLCFENTQKAIKYQNDKEDPTAEFSLKPRGMPQALVVWMLKLFPHLLNKYGSELRTKGKRPLILTVLCEEVITYKKLCEKMKGVVHSDETLQAIRAIGVAFPDAAWEEAVSENHDVEDDSADGPHDQINQAMNYSDDNRHVDQEVRDNTTEVIGAGSHQGVSVSAGFINNFMAEATNGMLNRVRKMIDGFSENMIQLIDSHAQRIGSVETMVIQLQRTICSPLENTTCGSLECGGPSKNSGSCNAESDEDDPCLRPTRNKEDEPVNKVDQEEAEDTRNNMTSEGTGVREIHSVESFVDSGHDEKNDSDDMEVDVMGTNPFTDLIHQDDVVEVFEKMQERMLTTKGGVIDLGIGKENILRDKALSVEEESNEEDRILGPSHNKEDETVDKVEEEEDDDTRTNMTTEATVVRKIHGSESFVESPLEDKNDSDGVVVESPKLVEKHAVENPATETDQNDQESNVEEDGEAEAEMAAKSNEEHCVPDSLVVGKLNTKCNPDGVKQAVDDHSPETTHVEDYFKGAVKVVSAEEPNDSADNYEEIIQFVIRDIDNNLEHYGDAEVAKESSDNPVKEHGAADPGPETSQNSQVSDAEAENAKPGEEDDGTLSKDVKGSRIIEMLDADQKQKILEYFNTHDRSYIAWNELKNDGRMMFDISGELLLQLTSEDAYLDSNFIDFYISRLRTKMNSNPIYGKAIFLSPKAYESFLNSKVEFNNFWIKKLASDYRECEPVKLFAPMSHNKKHFSLLEYDLINGASWGHRNSLGDMKTKNEHYVQAKTYAKAISRALNYKIPLALSEKAKTTRSPKQASYPECLLFVCYYMKCGMKNTEFERYSSRKNARMNRVTVPKVFAMRASMLYKIISDADSRTH